MPLEAFKAERKQLKAKANRIRAAKCRRATRPFARWAWQVRPYWRGHVLRYWRSRVAIARRLDSRCLEARLWTWFRTSGAACVKANEGAWTSNTGNGYYGGFQADVNFQLAYGGAYYARWGTANRWPPVAQVHMAWRGWRARGWHPWPNTARECGLL